MSNRTNKLGIGGQLGIIFYLGATEISEKFIFGQSQVFIATETKVQFGQAQAIIKQIYFVLGQAQTKLNAFNIQESGQTQAYVNLLKLGQGQTQASIITTTQVLAQTQTDIRQTYLIFSQTQAQLIIESMQFGQTIVCILATSLIGGQAQALLGESLLVGIANTQASILRTTRVVVQAQTCIIVVTNKFAQTRAVIDDRINQGQAQAYIWSGVQRNLQYIEERINPRTQIYWRKFYTLYPTTQLSLPPISEVPAATGYTTLEDWIPFNGTTLEILRREPPDFIKQINNRNVFDESPPDGDWNSKYLTTIGITGDYVFSNFKFDSIIDVDKTKTKIDLVRVWINCYTVLAGAVNISWKHQLNPTQYRWEPASNSSGTADFSTLTYYSQGYKYAPWDDSTPWDWGTFDNLVIGIDAPWPGLPGDSRRVYYLWMEVWLSEIDRTNDIPLLILPKHADTHAIMGSDPLNISISQVTDLAEELNIDGISTDANLSITGNWTFIKRISAPRINVQTLNLEQLHLNPTNRPISPHVGDVYVDEGDKLTWFYNHDGWHFLVLEGMFGYPEPIKTFGQTQAHLIGHYIQSAQSLALIGKVFWDFGQAKTKIKHVQGTGLAQTSIRNWITYNRSWQSQAYIKLPQMGFGQAAVFLDHIKPAQAQATIITTTPSGQARVVITIDPDDIPQILRQNGIRALYFYYNSSAGQYVIGTEISPIYFDPSSGQKTIGTESSFVYFTSSAGQIQAAQGLVSYFNPWAGNTPTGTRAGFVYWVNAWNPPAFTYNKFAQAGTYMYSAYFIHAWVGLGQAQVKVRAFGSRIYAQTKTKIKAKVNNIGQAQVKII